MPPPNVTRPAKRTVEDRAWELFCHLAPNHNILKLTKPDEARQLVELAFAGALAFEEEAKDAAIRMGESRRTTIRRAGGDAAR